MIYHTYVIQLLVYYWFIEIKRYNMDKDIEIINVRLPEEIVRWLDSLVDKKVFRNRSEAIREFARDYVLNNGEIN